MTDTDRGEPGTLRWILHRAHDQWLATGEPQWLERIGGEDDTPVTVPFDQVQRLWRELGIE